MLGFRSGSGYLSVRMVEEAMNDQDIWVGVNDKYLANGSHTDCLATDHRTVLQSL
jgi:hypothetical protein